MYVEGRIRTENVKDKSGVEVQRKKIKAMNVQFLHLPKEPEGDRNQGV